MMKSPASSIISLVVSFLVLVMVVAMAEQTMPGPHGRGGPNVEPTSPAKGLLNMKLPATWDFEEGTGGWRFQGCSASVSRAVSVSGTASLRMDARFPGEAKGYFEGTLQFDRLSEVQFSFYVPKGAPRSIKALFYAKDKHGVYYQYLYPGKTRPGQWQKVKVNVRPESADMEPQGHAGQWNRLVAARISHMGIKFISDEPYEGPIYVDRVIPRRDSSRRPGLRFLDFREGRPVVDVFDKYEISFRLNQEFSNPFDPDEIAINAYFSRNGDDKTYRVPAFFYQEYTRQRHTALLLGFEDGEANDFSWDVASTKGDAPLCRVKKAGKRASQGDNALWVKFGDLPGVVSFTVKSGTARDWRRYDALEIDCFNPGDTSTEITGQIYDSKASTAPNDSGRCYNFTRKIPPGMTTLRFPLNSLFRGKGGGTELLDLGAMQSVSINGRKCELYFDNLRLIKGGPAGDLVGKKELFRVQEANKELQLERREVLAPLGVPCWKVRFTPTAPGRYTYYLEAQAGGDPTTLVKTQPRYFDAVKSGRRGFVRISKKDPKYFEFDNGEFFYPIGHNVRSPFDERWWIVVLRGNKLPPDLGTYTYENVFGKMHENGENFAEIWMASWWLAIEWTSEWRGYHGLTNYNLENAWKLDYMLELAEKYDIYIHLVFDNHGKGSTWVDPEWDENPYNRANGGPVPFVEDYFKNPDAREIYKKTLRYIVARWAYSPRIMGFELWSELDLTGDSYSFVSTGSQVKTDWHREISAYLKGIDPWDHLVTTHFSTNYGRVDPRVVSLPNIDYVVVDAYRNKGSIVKLLLDTYRVLGKYGKPTFVTEYGGSPWATSADQVIPLLKADLHAGLWATYMTTAGATPLLWWFEFIDHQDQYFRFKPLAAFAKGEDRRGKGLASGRAFVQANTKVYLRLSALTLKNTEMAYVWVYDRMAMEQWPEPGDEMRFRNVTVTLPRMRVGEYSVEVWNTLTGKIMQKKRVRCSGALRIPLPEFVIDCALKVKRAE